MAAPQGPVNVEGGKEAMLAVGLVARTAVEKQAVGAAG